MSTMFSFRVGEAGKAQAHLNYISRVTAVLEGVEGMIMQNLPESVGEAGSYRELRENLSCYAWAREQSELAQHKSSKECRTHYRIMASFERDMGSEKIKEMVEEWLEKKLPLARACGFIHRDTEHVHVHVWVDARQLDGYKVHFSTKSYKNLGGGWNQIYARELGQPEREYWERIEHNRNQRGSRERSKGQSRQQYQEREQRNMGVSVDQARVRGDQREIAKESARSGEGSSEAARERAVFTRRVGEISGVIQEAGQRVQAIAELKERTVAVENSAERVAGGERILGERERVLAESQQRVERTSREFQELGRAIDRKLEREIEREYPGR